MQITNQKLACIFDMDGVLLDNKTYHKKAWAVFLQRYSDKKTFNYNELMLNFFGKTNQVIFEFLFEKSISQEELAYWEDIKESIYREIIAPEIKPLGGLINFLNELKQNGIKIAIGTSPLVNVNFVLDCFKANSYFDAIVDSNQVKIGKPNPEVFIKCADKLNFSPKNCIVFEDSFAGISAALSADMKVIGVATEHSKDVLLQKGATLAINNFNEIDITKLLII